MMNESSDRREGINFFGTYAILSIQLSTIYYFISFYSLNFKIEI